MGTYEYHCNNGGVVCITLKADGTFQQSIPSGMLPRNIEGLWLLNDNSIVFHNFWASDSSEYGSFNEGVEWEIVASSKNPGALAFVGGDGINPRDYYEIEKVEHASHSVK